MSNYDWIRAYQDAASMPSGAQERMQFLLDNNPNSKQLLANGTIRAPELNPETPYWHEKEAYQDTPANSQSGGLNTSLSYVDWSKMPRMGPAGDTPKGSIWAQVNSNSRVDPWSMKPIGVDPNMGPTYNDPNWGLLQLIRAKAPEDPVMKYGKMAIMGGVTAGMASALAPFLASGLGLGAGSNPLMAAFLRALPGLAQGRNPLAAAGSIAGGATGVPFGSTLGGAAGSYLGRPGG